MTRTKILGALLVGLIVLFGPSALPIPSPETLREEAVAARGEVNSLKQKIEETAAVAESADFPSRAAIAELAVPAGPDLPGLIDELQDVANQAQMTWVAGAPLKVSNDSGSENIWTMSMNLEGRLGDLPVVLDLLGVMDRLVTVDSISFQRASGDDIAVTILLRFYATTGEDTKDASTETEVTP
jgi:hypothetical protein